MASQRIAVADGRHAQFIESDDKSAAVKACCETLKKYTDQLDETVTIDVEIRPELE